MGLLRDAFGPAMGSEGVKNGFGGPHLPFAGGRNQQSQRPRSTLVPDTLCLQPQGRNPPCDRTISRLHSRNSSFGTPQSAYDHRYQDWYDPRARSSVSLDNHQESYNQYIAPSDGSPPPYSTGNQQPPYLLNYRDQNQDCYSSMTTGSPSRHQGYSRRSSFRPVVLPATGYGDGQPFLRGYSHELQQYDISRSTFISIVDAINTAIIPNPELQIFQKGANVAGWFLPGAESIGLMGGQIVAGVGGAYFSNNTLSKVLAKANLDVFVPQGLEICIGSSQDVDNEVGVQSSQLQPVCAASPVEKLRAYGNLLAPLDEVLPSAQQQGRTDPIAMYGRNISRRDNDRKARNAQKALARGRVRRVTKMEEATKWLIVRQASEQAISAWQKVLQQSNAELVQSQVSPPVRA